MSNKNENRLRLWIWQYKVSRKENLFPSKIIWKENDRRNLGNVLDTSKDKKSFENCMIPTYLCFNGLLIGSNHRGVVIAFKWYIYKG